MDLTTIRHSLDHGGVDNPAIRAFVEEWALLTAPERIEIISAEDDARLRRGPSTPEKSPGGPRTLLHALPPQGHGPPEGRTVVATSDPADKGLYNNWRPASEVLAVQRERVAGPRGQDDVRHPHHGGPRLAPGPLRRGRPDHRQPRRRPPDDPHGASRPPPLRRTRRPVLLRPRRPRDRRPRRPRPGHGRGSPPLRHHRRSAPHHPLRLLLRRQRPPGEDRPLAPIRLRRMEVREVPRRAVHAPRNRRHADGAHLPRLRRIPLSLGEDEPQ